MYNIKPHISEKSVNLSSKNEFTLLVPISYTKTKIATVTKEIFSVGPIDIRTVSIKSVTSRKAKGFKTEKAYKKAIIKLDKKQSIPGFQTFAEEMKKAEVTSEKKAKDVTTTVKKVGEKK